MSPRTLLLPATAIEADAARRSGGPRRMKTIFLLRHAKSDWGAASDSDHERPLNERGRKAAALIGDYLARRGELPDRVISSSAVRARETIRLAAQSGRWPCPIDTTPELYETSPDRVLQLIRRQSDSLQRLLLVGHQPTWSLLVDELVGGADVKLPTAAVVRIDVPVEHWREVGCGAGNLIWRVTPKQLLQSGR